MTTRVPIPPDPERFKNLSPDKPATLPPDFRLPTGEELARQTLRRMAETYERGIDGN